MNYFHYRIWAMKAKPVKTKINQLVKFFGGRDKVADKLMVTPRYIYYFEKGEKVPSKRLYRDICNLHDRMADNQAK